MLITKLSSLVERVLVISGRRTWVVVVDQATLDPMLEADLETLFSRAVARAGGITEKLAPTRAGVPDRLVLMPGGHIYLVELKTSTGPVRDIQKVWHERARRRCGVEVIILRGQKEIETWIRSVSE